MERRLAAILAADVVGYSRLMGEDEVNTLARLEGLRAELLDPLILQHRGRVVRVMGDGFLVEFASVVDALACALSWQDAVEARASQGPANRALRFRIGINLGDIIVKDDDIYGDGVNIAARLEAMAEPGSVLVSRTVADHAKGKVKAVFEDKGEHALKNISQPVRVFRASMEPETAAATVAAETVSRSVKRPLIAATLGVLVAAIGVALWQQPWQPREEPASVENMTFPLPDKPSIAVLPFTNISDDPEQDYFANGMTEDLITDLSKISGLFVISRNSTHVYKNQHVKVQQVAEDLGVRYILEGSVRRVGDEVRINAQLIDALTAGHTWAERYDGALADVFGLQDKVIAKIVEALALRLTSDEQRALTKRGTNNLDAYDAFLRGWQHYLRDTPESFSLAIPLFEEALRFDPAYSRPQAALAALYYRATYNVWGIQMGFASTEELRQKSELHLNEALKNPTPVALVLQAYKLRRAHEFDAAIAKAREAVALHPNDPDSHLGLSLELTFAGDPEGAIPVIEMAQRLDPLNRWRFAFAFGLAFLGMDRPREAAQALKAGLEGNPNNWEQWFLYAAAAAMIDDMEEAAKAVNQLEVLKRNNHLNPRFMTINFELSYWAFKRESDLDRIAAGLRKAGVPE